MYILHLLIIIIKFSFLFSTYYIFIFCSFVFFFIIREAAPTVFPVFLSARVTNDVRSEIGNELGAIFLIKLFGRMFFLLLRRTSSRFVVSSFFSVLNALLIIFLCNSRRNLHGKHH